MTPSQKPTPSEYAVLIVCASVALVILGITAIVVAGRAPSEKQELAATVMNGGILSLALGITLAVAFWLFRRLSN
jgi:hypothetical protein